MTWIRCKYLIQRGIYLHHCTMYAANDSASKKVTIVDFLCRQRSSNEEIYVNFDLTRSIAYEQLSREESIYRKR